MANIDSDNFITSGATKVSGAEAREHEVPLFAKRVVQLPSNQKERWDYGARTDGQPDYWGFAPKGLAEGSDGWIIYKYTYSGSNATEKNIAYGNWTNRASETYE